MVLAPKKSSVSDSPKRGQNGKCLLLPPSAVTHISQKSVPKSRFLTASPSREKPLVVDRTVSNRKNILRYGTRLLPSGRHPRVASLAPLGQFTFTCQPLALRNQWLTDVGHRRRRQQYDPAISTVLGEFVHRLSF